MVQSGTSAARVTRRLVDMVLDTTYASLPPHVQHATKRVILDTIAVTIGAFDTPIADALLHLKRDQGGRADSTLMLYGGKVPAASAVYIHAQLANLLDADESLHNRCHYASASVMAALAIGEMTGASGEEVIAAVATGFELTTRVGLALHQFETNEAGNVVFAPLFGFSWMSFGAAAAAGKLLGLNAEQLGNALGQAYVTTPVVYSVINANAPLYEETGVPYWHRYQMSGPATEVGVNAALLAADGWVARRDIFDEGSEYWQSFAAPSCDWDYMYGGLGESWFIGETSMKRWPSCRFGHSALDLFSEMVLAEGLGPDDIDAIHINAAPNEVMRLMSDNAVINDPLKLVMSLPTQCGLIACRVPPGPKWWSGIEREDVRAIARKVTCVLNDEWRELMAEQVRTEGIFKKVPTEVIVRTSDGRELRKFADYAYGDPWAEGFEMADEELFEKARDYTDGFLPLVKVDQLIAAVMTLESAPDLGHVTQAMVK